MGKRRTFSSEFKFKVALEAAKGVKTMSDLAQEYQLHPNQISEWKRQLLEKGAEVFDTSPGRQEQEQTHLEADLYEQIGRLKMENEWLKKKYAQSH
jgi:putative transposase